MSIKKPNFNIGNPFGSITCQTTQLSKKLGYHKIIRLFVVEIAIKKGR
jgi:hypothetical protein